MKMLAMTVLCVDKYPEILLEVVGGNSLNIAAQWAFLGEKHIAVLGAVGSDYLGELVIDYLKKTDIEHTHVFHIPGQTAHNHFYKSEDSELFHEDSWVNGVFGEYRLKESDWEYVDTFDLIAIEFCEPNFPQTFKRYAGKKQLAVDFLNSKDIQKIKEIMPLANLGFASGDRVMAESFLEFSKIFNNPIIVTAGVEGSYCVYKGQLYFEPSAAVNHKVDTIGCGDSYQAGFIVSWYKDHDIQKAMKKGAAAASRILQCYGGVIDFNKK